MKFSAPIPIQEIARRINAQIIGNTSQLAWGINEIHKVQCGDITFVDVEKYFNKSLQSAATIIILNKEVVCPEGKTLLLHDNPFEAYNSIIKWYRPFQSLNQNIHPTAQVHPTAIIEPNVMIGAYATIGENSYIQANVSIQEYTLIGKNVVIQSGSVIGSDAFYFKKHPEGFEQWRSGGRVLIEDNVLVGAGCTVAKCVSSDTIIGQGSKLDCQVHLGHGVVIGKNCLLAAQVGIGGNTVLGDEVVLYGQVGIAQNLHIGDKAIILAKSGVSKDLEGGKVYFGYPATEAREKYKELATLRQLAKK